MEMQGEYRIAASQEQVWAALNDPEVLKASIPGCDSLEGSPEEGFKAKVTAKVGPVKAKFAGEVALSDIDAPNGYTISGEGKGGAAGFAKGGATVRLVTDGNETVLSYNVQASVGGKLAQLGARLIDGTAKKMADEFFAKFSELAAAYDAEVTSDADAETTADAVERAVSDTSPETVADVASETQSEAAASETDAETEPTALAEPEIATAAPASETSTSTETDTGGGLPTWVWAGGLVVIVILGLLIFGS